MLPLQKNNVVANWQKKVHFGILRNQYTTFVLRHTPREPAVNVMCYYFISYCVFKKKWAIFIFSWLKMFM